MMKFRSIFVIAFFLFASSLTAQQGRVRVTGKVTDGETGEALPGANVIVKGTTIGTISELNGEFSMLVPGSGSVLVFSFLGYTSQEVTVGDQRNINIELAMETETLDEVVVTAQAKGQIGARRQQINSNTVKNVVSKDRLQENPDANAVEAIGRLPGISVLRSGGEGSEIVIRGLEPRYTNVTMEGVTLPSTSAYGRGANISGISQYILQGVEVYKALTPDMEANSVGGTVNLKLQETPAGLHYNVMAQGGYNNMNNYLGNYKLLGEISNRFLDNKLGLFLSASTERVNRSTQTMSGNYAIESDSIDIWVKESSLNIVNRINTRQSATLSLDYRLNSSTKLKFFGMYSHSNIDQENQSKAYNHTGTGAVGYNIAHNPLNESSILHTTLSGQTNTNFLNMVVDYGVAYSQSRRNSPAARSWGFSFYDASNSDITTIEHRRMSPAELIPLFWDDNDSLQNTMFGGMSSTSDEQLDKNLSAHIDFTVPFNAGDLVSGDIKFGGKYKQTNRFRDVLSGSQGQHPFQVEYWYEALPWLVRSRRAEGTFENFTLEGFEDHVVDDFLGGAYDYGLYFNHNMLNEVSDWWEEWSKDLIDQGQDVWLEMVGDRSLIGYRQSLEASMVNDQDLVEDYYAGYLMGDMNIGKWLTLIPGFRYEKTNASMNGWESWEPMFTESTDLPLTATKDTSATRADEFFLPMVHLRVKPSKFMYFHLAYTQTISRPDYHAISPNYYNNPTLNVYPHRFKTVHQKPDLKAERWTNIDAQVTFHGTKIGLFSVNGFYKTVEDKIWNRTFNRIRGDSIVPGFPDNYTVQISQWENHQYEVVLKGVEFEWQTSFWYLPGVLKYFTTSLNYTFTHSETKYPHTRLEMLTPPEGGRPVLVRIDSVTSGPMLFQPRHIFNASLGFNYKGFNTWLSFQYNGRIFTSKSYFLDELDGLKENFYRMDLQMTYELPLKLPGQLQVMANFANLSDFEEISRQRGDPRYTYREAYGWTVDLGVRYKF